MSFNPEQVYRQALSAWQNGRLVQAEKLYRKLLQHDPGHPVLLHDLGGVLLMRGVYAEAADLLEQCLVRMPDHLAAHANIGVAYYHLGQPQRALLHYDWVLQHDARHLHTLNNRSLVLKDSGQLEEARAGFSRVLEMEPRHVNAMANLGSVLNDLGRTAEALAVCDRALTLEPAHRDALINKGVILIRLNRPDEALALFKAVVAAEPGRVDAWINMGVAYREMHAFNQAHSAFDQALKRNETNAEARWYKALLLLLQGSFREGWSRFESRWERPQARADRRDFAQPLWLNESGEDLTEKTLLLHAEQGYGDTLQFCRYVPRVRALGATVILEVQPPLVSLLQGQFPGVTVIPQHQPLPAFDLHCPLMSLPLAFRTELDTIPADIPYLQARPERIAAWGERLGPRQRPRIGLVWSGNPAHKNDHNRSLRLSQLEDLLQLPYDWHILQKDIQPGDQDTLRSVPQLQDHRTELTDFDATAGLLSHMDVLISVDTSVAHLAGAMGKPVWLLLPYMPDYRWLLDRTDSPWYPSFTLYRQPAIGDWGTVVEDLRRRLPAGEWA